MRSLTLPVLPVSVPVHVPPCTLRQGLNRIGNLLVPNDNYCKFQDWIFPILDTMLEEQKNDGVVWTPSKMIRRLGLEINHKDRSARRWEGGGQRGRVESCLVGTHERVESCLVGTHELGCLYTRLHFPPPFPTSQTRNAPQRVLLGGGQ